MERTGEVTAVQGEWLDITFCRPADCEKCNACRGGQKTVSLRLKGKALPGDKVVVRMAEATIAKASLIAYALPLLGLMLGLLAGEALLPDSSSLGGILGGVAGLALSLLIIRLTESKRQQDPRWEASIVRVIPHEPND